MKWLRNGMDSPRRIMVVYLSHYYKLFVDKYLLTWKLPTIKEKKKKISEDPLMPDE